MSGDVVRPRKLDPNKHVGRRADAEVQWTVLKTEELKRCYGVHMSKEKLITVRFKSLFFQQDLEHLWARK